ncbi:MAG: nitroreductase family protein [Deltaproteobacteria bacterium]|uniref:Nitroreductase family protein n=1 Tax=Candidatus Zymogenus saltonus TaxID=2844893 RepID=A0A9D8KFV0_9DELT|nr:nitroreductase family protein [Candidatus Zymogenus saltonus]
MELREILRRRRSVRSFQEREVPTELVKEVIADACLAPSSGNGQPWKFIVVNDQDTIRRLSDESKAALLSDIEKDPKLSVNRYAGAIKNEEFNVFYNAPCLVLIVGERKLNSLPVDCALAASYFMFSAAERGLGTCWVGLGSQIRSRKTREEIGLPDDYAIVAPIAVGYPERVPEPTPRNAPKILKVID